MEKLTPKQAKFVGEYLIDFNASQAALRAGYSERTAYRIGAENLQKPQIIQAIQQAMEERERRLQLRQDQVLIELAKLGFSDIKEYVNAGPGGVVIKDLSEIKNTAAIQEIVEKEYKGVKEVRLKLHDKVRALEALLKHLTPAEPYGRGADGLSVNVQVINQVNRVDVSGLSVEELEYLDRASAILAERAADTSDTSAITAGAEGGAGTGSVQSGQGCDQGGD